MSTGTQVSLSPEDRYVEDVYARTEDLDFDVDVMSRRDVMTLGMAPIKKFRVHFRNFVRERVEWVRILRSHDVEAVAECMAMTQQPLRQRRCAENRLILPNAIQLVSSMVTLGSMVMISVGANDLVTTYVYVHSSQTMTWGCMEVDGGHGEVIDRFRPRGEFARRVAWVWIACGIWGGILPLVTGFLMNCTTNLSSKSPVNESNYFGTIFYNANFPPRDPPGVNILRLLSLIDLIVVFILSIINALVSKPCDNPAIYPQSKYLFPIMVAVISAVVFLLLLFSPRVKRRSLSRDENLHVGHTHILIRKFPANEAGGRYPAPELVGHGAPVVPTWGQKPSAKLIAN